MSSSDDSLKKATRDYHFGARPGKISLKTTKPCDTQLDLSLAYTPGVATPCLDIQANPDDIWKYTAKGNLVAVVSDGTAVLGLGNIGPGAGLPVMEGKAVLFKKFADIDAFPLCIGSVFDKDGNSDARKIIETVKRLEPTFGGINLEDIAAPACFKIEKTLKKMMSIPVFHDDQHGTAIISLAAVMSAVKLVGKDIRKCKFVLNGAGAAGIACAEYYISAGGAQRRNFILCDSKGVIYKGRTEGMNAQKKRFAVETDARTLTDALKGADLFVGLSKGNCVTEEMVRGMAPNAIIFAMANPTPEISPEKALAAGAAVVGTGRSDFPNQINNVLGFPGIFRGALDVRATDINEEMKFAASKALAEIVNEKIPAHILGILKKAYPKDAEAGMFDGETPLKKNFVIPKPFDPRVVPRVAKYVAEAAMKTGFAKAPIADLEKYEQDLIARMR
ncbi:MAG: malic enzyme-like NAD(P)-binding protein [Victivallales bacterium]